MPHGRRSGSDLETLTESWLHHADSATPKAFQELDQRHEQFIVLRFEFPISTRATLDSIEKVPRARHVQAFTTLREMGLGIQHDLRARSVGKSGEQLDELIVCDLAVPKLRREDPELLQAMHADLTASNPCKSADRTISSYADTAIGAEDLSRS